MPKPPKLGKITFSSLSLPEQIQMSNLQDAVNILGGHSGEVELSNHLNLSGNKITNVAPPTAESDVLTSGVAETKYSAAALKPQISPSGSQPMLGYRIINSGSQREAQSSFLNDLMSTPPNANNIYPLLSNVSGGVKVIIPASPFTFADGSTILLLSRTDTLSLPTVYAISTIGCVSNLVTVQTVNPISVSRGQVVTIIGVSPAGFNGPWEVTTYTPPNEFTYQDFLGTVSGSGGNVELGNTYYYMAKKRSQFVALVGPLSGDTAYNRLRVCADGSQIVAVVSLTSSGGVVAQSGGGGSPIIGSPTAGSFF
jgi:hypothetical protein